MLFHCGELLQRIDGIDEKRLLLSGSESLG